MPCAGCPHWAFSQLRLPTPGDGGYDGAVQGIHTPLKLPSHGNVLAPDHLAYNALHRGTRALGERGLALLTTRWRSATHDHHPITDRRHCRRRIGPHPT